MFNPPDNGRRDAIPPDAPDEPIDTPIMGNYYRAPISAILTTAHKSSPPEPILSESQKQHPLARMREVCPEEFFQRGGFLERILVSLPRHTDLPNVIQKVTDELLLEAYYSNAETVGFTEGRTGKHGLGQKSMAMLELYLYRTGAITKAPFIEKLKTMNSKSLKWAREIDLAL
jgi:hypothetical protein